MSCVVIVQARMGSTRLPGKVLEMIGGQPMLARVVERASAARSIDRLVVATTTDSRDDVLVDLASKRGWDLVRGSENDVLDRYYHAAVGREASIVVRVTGDCPLIDPVLIDDVIGALRDEHADYASNTLEPRTYPRGLDVEAMTFSALADAWHDDTNTAWREHVTPYLYRNGERFRLARVETNPSHADHRWSVDTSEDLDLVRRLWEATESRGSGWRDVLAVAQEHPDWAALNADVQQVVLP
jgi:spore coat polysaccharide biosynthesis protein SpsF